MSTLIYPTGTPLVRQLKLHALVGAKVSTDARIGLIVAFFTKLFDGMQFSIIPEYSNDTIIFHKGETYYMEQFFIADELWCRNNGFWSYLHDIGLDYVEIQVVVKFMVEKHLRQQIENPSLTSYRSCSWVERHLRHQVGSPRPYSDNVKYPVEKYLRNYLL